MAHDDLFHSQLETRNSKPQPVECLGMTFESDDARRAYFLEQLKAGLHELRVTLDVPFTSLEETLSRLKSLKHWPLGTEEQIHDLAERMAHAASRSSNSQPATRNSQLLALYKAEVGFPIGSDEDILALSDPPYYTACPNPWIADFIAEWEAEKEKLRVDGLRVTGSDNQLATLNSQPATPNSQLIITASRSPRM